MTPLSVFSLFLEGGALFMCILTLLLVALFFAAWKAPAWVKEIGKIAYIFGIFSFFISCTQAASFIQMCKDNLDQSVLAGGLKVALICPIYGCIIYMISLIIRIVQKPRA